MQYLGGKSRICKSLGLFLNNEIDRVKPVRYIEPFCGSCWVISQIKPEIIRIACDVHKDLILMWQDLQKQWIPPDTISENEYHQLKNSPPSSLRGFTGFGCSFGGKWFGGYARDPKSDRNYCLNTKNSVLKRIKLLKNVYFKCCSYTEIPIANLENRFFYCDPPYYNTTGYKDTPKFDHSHFWNWVRELSLKNYVYVSEYVCPKDFDVVWQTETRTDLEKTGGGKSVRVERVFQFKDGLK